MQKMKFAYSYFILPYFIQKDKYDKYLEKLILDDKNKIKEFSKEKDLETYTFFTQGFLDNFNYLKDLNADELDYLKNKKYTNKSKKNIFAGYKGSKLEDEKVICKRIVNKLKNKNILFFERKVNKDHQGKIGDEECIYFSIEKMTIITTKEGICFLVIKTNIDSEDFGDLLNFNYRFRELSTDVLSLRRFENILIQSNDFKTAKDFHEKIEEIIGLPIDKIIKEDETDKMYTFSYVCTDTSVWNNETTKEELATPLYKFVEIHPNFFNNVFSTENTAVEMVEDLKYSKIGITNLSSNLFSSGIEIQNFTKVPLEYEKINIYIYIYAIYQKLYLNSLNRELEQLKIKKDLENISKKYSYFSKKIWNKEITLEHKGVVYFRALKKAMNLNETYNVLLNKYSAIYKAEEIEKNNKMYKYILITLSILIVVNVLVFLLLNGGIL